MNVRPACGKCPNEQYSCFKRGCIALNGFEKSIKSINALYPAPAIGVCLGDRVIVDVYNQLPSTPATVHWHGVRQKRTPYFDGVPMVTQCPILPGTKFRYDFTADTTGTHYYRMKAGRHSGNTLAGSLIVHSPEDPLEPYYDYDIMSHHIVITDGTKVEDEMDVFSKSPTPDSIFLNGFGSSVDPTTKGPTRTPIFALMLHTGFRYRLRIIAALAYICPVEFSVNSHEDFVFFFSNRTES